MNNVLLNVDLCVHPEDSNQNRYFSFRVNPLTEKLLVDFSYHPKYLSDDEAADKIIEDGIKKYVLPERQNEYSRNRDKFKPLVNLLTISIDSPNGYIGAAHRHESDQHHWISADSSAPGFCRCAIEPGDWKICLSTHAVVTTDCYVSIIVTECK